MRSPEPLIVSWQGHQVRIRHDDPHLGPYTPRGAVIRSAIELASDVEGLRLVLVTTVGDRYSVRVSDDGSVVGLRRRTGEEARPSGTGRAPRIWADGSGYSVVGSSGSGTGGISPARMAPSYMSVTVPFAASRGCWVRIA